MKKTYIVTYDLFDGFDVRIFHNFLNASSTILNWLAPALPGVVVVISRLDLDEVTGLIGEHMNGRSYMVAETNPHSVNGWLPSDVWQFISNAPEAPPLKQDVVAQPNRITPTGPGAVAAHPTLLAALARQSG